MVYRNGLHQEELETQEFLRGKCRTIINTRDVAGGNDFIFWLSICAFGGLISLNYISCVNIFWRLCRDKSEAFEQPLGPDALHQLYDI